MMLLACGGKHVALDLHAPAEDPGVIALAPVAMVQSIPGAVEADAFAENLTVGHVQLSGGFIQVVELGMQTRSLNVEVEAEDLYAEQSALWLESLIQSTLADGGIAWTPAALDTALLPAPQKIAARGSDPRDGDDNVNLPRYALSPAPLGPEAVAALAEAAPTADAVLVPLIVHYYTHNGGWFAGHDYGCAGGARIRVLWTLYAPTGAPLGWGDLDVRELSEHDYSPNRARLEDYLLAAEDRAAKQIGRHLLK